MRIENLAGEVIFEGSISDLTGADLSGANLWRADLAEADLSGADLRGADLAEADLSGANLRGADLSGADLRGADLRGADLSGANLLGADLAEATMPDGRLWEEYLLDPLAGICHTEEARSRAIAARRGHSWRDCPAHAALGIGGLDEIEEDALRSRVATFVTVHDAYLLESGWDRLAQSITSIDVPEARP